tara:strand:- start:758 stop:1678 length:921 start_codon:yes stop_codon:yes gene_type:complete
MLKMIPHVLFILKKWKADVIHTHFVDANIIGLTAGMLGNIPKRIYTRHHNTYHHDYARKGVFLDRYSNILATDIISISRRVSDTLVKREGVPLSKIVRINHGFKPEPFVNPSPSDVELLKVRYSVESGRVIGVIARHIYWKGVKFIVKAFKELMSDYPDTILFLANARGDQASSIRSLLSSIPKSRYRLVPFEPNVGALYRLFHVYVHTPIDPDIEAFGQTYVEALMAGIPSVFTVSGIAHDFVEHERNALVVSYKNEHEICVAIRRILDEKDLGLHLSQQGRRDAITLFSLEKMVRQLLNTYEKE